jgi:hypothetical protein
MSAFQLEWSVIARRGVFAGIAGGWERDAMTGRANVGYVLLALVCMGLGLIPVSARAITAEVARKCNALTAKQFPPREPGNPAAGSAKGSGRDQNEFFNKCVANGGKVDDNATK